MISWGTYKIEKLLIGDFFLRNRFLSSLSDDMISQALRVVNAQFSGVYSLWSILPPDEARAKRELCINYLVGWQLAYNYPSYAINVQGVGAIPLSSKKIGPISLTYRNMLRQAGGALDMLTTNEFGIEALSMIQTAPENFILTR